MKTAIIIGSHKKVSQSAKVAKFIEHVLRLQDESSECFLLDLGKDPLPLWDESMWQEGSDIREVWNPVSEELKSADSFVIISPEYGGMVPSSLKNFFLLCDDYELAHKPALIIGVSAGRGGAYPVAELRMSSAKNNFLCYIPEHVVVRDVKNVLNDKSEGSEKADVYLKKRINHALNILAQYAKALKPIRHKDLHDFETYPYGM